MANSDLHARSQRSPAALASAAYWRRLCPGLHVGDEAFQAQVRARTEEVADKPSCMEVRGRLLEEGFAALPPDKVQWSVDVGKLAKGVVQLEQHGWPATFIAMFDEAWAMGRDAAYVMAEATGNTPCMDVVGFVVDPQRSRGFSPHRDRQPEDWTPRNVPADVGCTFREDGMAKYVTLWAALTDAHPENSCLHFVPKACDPGYLAGDPEGPHEADPMQRCFPNKDAFRSIRCAPVAAGGCTFHTHRTIHWGSRGRSTFAGGPRISLSFGFSAPDFEPPYLPPRSLPFPRIGLRAALVAAQVLNYATLAAGDSEGWVALAGAMADCGAETMALLHRTFQRHAKAFHSTYRSEIARKFVCVSLALGPGASLCAHAATGSRGEGAAAAAALPSGGEAPPDEDQEELALEAMLEAEATTGEVLFHDDFDVMNAPRAEARPRRKRKRPREEALSRGPPGAGTAEPGRAAVGRSAARRARRGRREV